MRRAINPAPVTIYRIELCYITTTAAHSTCCMFFVIFFSLPPSRLTQMFPRDTNTAVDIVNI